MNQEPVNRREFTQEVFCLFHVPVQTGTKNWLIQLSTGATAMREAREQGAEQLIDIGIGVFNDTAYQNLCEIDPASLIFPDCSII